MTNEQIDKHIEVILIAANKVIQPQTMGDEALIEAGVRLLGNLLRNVNDIAEAARPVNDVREAPRNDPQAQAREDKKNEIERAILIQKARGERVLAVPTVHQA